MSQSTFEAPVDSVFADDQLDASALHDAFADERRRTTLAVLATETAPVDGATLARAVATAETAAATVEQSVVDRVHAMLYHVHLPKLDDLGLIDYDPEADEVAAVADVVDDYGL